MLTTAGSRTEYGGMKKFALSLCAAAAVCCASADEVFSPAPEDVKILGTEGDLAKVLKRDIGFGEGALYRPSTGEVFFSDQPKNMIYRWTEKDGFSVFMRPAGYTGAKGQMDKSIDFGPNAIALDGNENLVFCQQGHRRIARIDEKRFEVEVLSDSYNGKKLNNTNDLCVLKDGSIFFTDPGFWHKRRAPEADELDFSGIYKITPKGETVLIDGSLPQPNGIDFSPDEEFMYVSQSGNGEQCWFVYELDETKTKVVSKRVFCSLKKWTGKVRGAPDGMAIGRDGWIYATGNGGVHLFSPDLKHRGLVKIENQVANCCIITDGETEKSLFVVGPKGAYTIDMRRLKSLARD